MYLHNQIKYIEIGLEKSSSAKKHGKNKAKAVLDVFGPPENDSGVCLALKNHVHTLTNLLILAVPHCITYYGLQNTREFQNALF